MEPKRYFGHTITLSELQTKGKLDVAILGTITKLILLKDHGQYHGIVRLDEGFVRQVVGVT